MSDYQSYHTIDMDLEDNLTAMLNQSNLTGVSLSQATGGAMYEILNFQYYAWGVTGNYTYCVTT